MNSTLVKVATCTAGALTFGWLAFAGSPAFPGGHPPLAYFVGAGAVLGSFVIAPMGAAATLAHLLRTRRRDITLSRFAAVVLRLNLLFLAVAVTLWFWMLWEASRR